MGLSRLLINTRWVRYLIAAILLGSAAIIVVGAINGDQIQQTSGKISAVTAQTNARTGADEGTLITLTQGSARYRLFLNAFTPPLPDTALEAGTDVVLWYTQSPPNDPQVVAIQFSPAPQQYVTADYLHPENRRNSNLITAGVLVVLGLLAVAAGIWLPAGGAPRGPTQPSGQPRVGERVFGPPRRP